MHFTSDRNYKKPTIYIFRFPLFRLFKKATKPSKFRGKVRFDQCAKLFHQVILLMGFKQYP